MYKEIDFSEYTSRYPLPSQYDKINCNFVIADLNNETKFSFKKTGCLLDNDDENSNIQLSIVTIEDEYYLVWIYSYSYHKDNYYLCDQYDGLVKCLKIIRKSIHL